MKTNVSKCDFHDAFINMNRGNNFSPEGLNALYDHMIEYEEGCGIEIELDVIALCCEFTEYGGIEEVKENYGDIENVEDLRDHTTVIDVSNGGLIIQNY